MGFDNIVIGAGSTGSVVAARLAERTDRRVLLVEAGPDYHGRALPPGLDDGRTPALGTHDWGFTAAGADGRRIWLPRGKVVGGCSAINTCIALRPEPSDFDDWPAGAADWTWPTVLAAFVAVEADGDGTGPRHGQEGALRIVRPTPERMTSLSRGFQDACVGEGFAAVADHNAPGSTGVGPLPLNVDAGNRRISTAEAFLAPARRRPNLTVMPDTLVDSVLFSGSRAVGVRVVTGGRVRHIDGDEVLVSAGALATPAVLQRSGVGAADDLGRLGIDVVADLPAVGRHLADHSQVPLVCAPAPDAVDTAALCAEVVLRYTATDSPFRNDMQLCVLNHVELAKYAPELATPGAPRHAFVISANLMRPSGRGRVRLTSRDPCQPPAIELDHTADPTDRERLRAGLRLARRVASHPSIRRLSTGCLGVDEVDFDDDRSVDRYVARQVQTAHHPSGTAAIGTSPAVGAVDAEGRVFGTEGLRVADASILPAPVRANTNLTCIMIGERMSRLLAGAA